MCRFGKHCTFIWCNVGDSEANGLLRPDQMFSDVHRDTITCWYSYYRVFKYAFKRIKCTTLSKLTNFTLIDKQNMTSSFFFSSQFSSCSVSRWHIDGNSFRLQWKINSSLTQSLSSAPSHTFPLCQLCCSWNSAGCILNFSPTFGAATFSRAPPDGGLTPRWLWKQHSFSSLSLSFHFQKKRCAGRVHSLHKFTNIFVVTNGKND